MAEMEKITFIAEDGESVDFYVLDQTRIGGINYILVTETEDGDGEALILKDLSEDGEEDSIFTIVSDETEFAAVAEVFKKMLDDLELVD